MTESFGARLRAQRELRGIDLSAIARSTKINVALFEAIERDDVSRWPSGIFRRAFMRAYAEAIGLDLESTVREFLERFPDQADDPHGSVVKSNSRGAASDDAWSGSTGALRLTLADEPWSFAGAQPWRRVRRLSAAIIDLSVVMVVAVAALAITGGFRTAFIVATLCYYCGSVAERSGSPGAWLVARAVARRRKTVATEVQVTPVRPPSTAASVDGVDNLRSFQPRRYRKAM
jgi:transcriptional regulator with XRE-family HTH domain